MDDIDATSKDYFFVKIANGQVPDAVVGGEHDGLRYFRITIEGMDYWLTEYGLMAPGCFQGMPRDTPQA